MPDKHNLSLRSKLYCHWLALGKSEAEAAEAVGFSAGEREDARRALSSPCGAAYRRAVLDALASRAGNGLSAQDGYYKLAFGDVSDALRLILRCGEEGDVLPGCGECPDLFNVSEIRRGKNGIELRFFDRLDALDRLSRLESEADGRSGICEALAAAAGTLGGEDDELE